ncbi:Histone deacetylase 6 [Dissostichus eleginoides]|uniref:Histone deacetylase 6 n=1 Tax=Dissostichus eleginoides TaxID=100907 RepID=A0AAD9CFQ8_DISEL|nr:Histone deacetylase 6 [Dissostichus eleginoides]
MKGHCERANEASNMKQYSQLKVVFHMAKNDIAGKVETCFLGNYDVHSGTAQCIFDKVDEVLRERDVKLSRVIGLGSDGASVMMGKRAGVGALLKRESAFCIQKEDVNLATIRTMVHASVAALTKLRDAPGPEEERFQADCQNGMYRDVNVTHADDRSRQAFSNVRVRYITHLRFKYTLNQPSVPLLVILAKGLPARMTQCKPVPLSLMPQARTEMPSL